MCVEAQVSGLAPKPLAQLLHLFIWSSLSGTGKSYVINAILQQAKLRYPSQQVVQIVSPTGAASKQFTGGKTIHSYLKLLVSKTKGKEKSFEELTEAKAQQLERDLANLRLLIIDEKGKGKECWKW